MGRTPQEFMHPGDTVAVGVTGVGYLTNPLVAGWDWRRIIDGLSAFCKHCSQTAGSGHPRGWTVDYGVFGGVAGDHPALLRLQHFYEPKRLRIQRSRLRVRQWAKAHNQES